jgi:hypothetical protein
VCSGLTQNPSRSGFAPSIRVAQPQSISQPCGTKWEFSRKMVVSPSATTNRRSGLGRRSQLPKQYLCRALIAKRIHGIDLRKNLSTCVTSCPLQPQTCRTRAGSLALAAAFAGLLGGTTVRPDAELLPHGGSTAYSVKGLIELDCSAFMLGSRVYRKPTLSCDLRVHVWSQFMLRSWLVSRSISDNDERRSVRKRDCAWIVARFASTASLQHERSNKNDYNCRSNQPWKPWSAAS